MTAASDYLENRVLTEYLVTKDCFIALYGVDPGDAGPGNEVSGGSYARKKAAFTVATGTATLSVDVVFPGMPTVTVSAIAIWDALSAGNMLFHGPIVQSKNVQAGDAFAFPAGNLTVSLD